MENVLLIEPDKVLASSYEQALEAAGFSVFWAGGAQEALVVAENCLPHIVVLELQLTGHNGIEFLQEFRSYADWRRIPVIVLTWWPPQRLKPFQERLRRDLGVVTMLYKPHTGLDGLREAVSALKDEYQPKAQL